jgi:hypothetical protein
MDSVECVMRACHYALGNETLVPDDGPFNAVRPSRHEKKSQESPRARCDGDATVIMGTMAGQKPFPADLSGNFRIRGRRF